MAQSSVLSCTLILRRQTVRIQASAMASSSLPPSLLPAVPLMPLMARTVGASSQPTTTPQQVARVGARATLGGAMAGTIGAARVPAGSGSRTSAKTRPRTTNPSPRRATTCTSRTSHLASRRMRCTPLSPRLVLSLNAACSAGTVHLVLPPSSVWRRPSWRPGLVRSFRAQFMRIACSLFRFSCRRRTERMSRTTCTSRAFIAPAPQISSTRCSDASVK
mmetsp:Transcript_109617/g.283334  ORF Transcript_109617/g.283334 Transcript_109617/m.283334 type:complete len:219 (-) Transcript_109617:839-1495(-)